MAHSNVQEPIPLELLRYAPTLPGGLKKPPPMKPNTQRRFHCPSGYSYRRHYVSTKEPRVTHTFNNLVERLYGHLFPLEPPNPLSTTPTPAELKQHHNHLRTHPHPPPLFRMVFDEATQAFTFHHRTTPPSSPAGSPLLDAVPREVRDLIYHELLLAAAPSAPCRTAPKSTCSAARWPATRSRSTAFDNRAEANGLAGSAGLLAGCCGTSSSRRLWARGQAEVRARGRICGQLLQGRVHASDDHASDDYDDHDHDDAGRRVREPSSAGCTCRWNCQTSDRRGRAWGAWSLPCRGLSI